MNIPTPWTTPIDIGITYHDEEKGFTYVQLGKLAAGQLYRYLYPVIAKVAPDFLEEYEYSAMAGMLSIWNLPRQYYPDICTAILNACDELDSLKPFKAELKTALEADPRFQQLQTAWIW